MPKLSLITINLNNFIGLKKTIKSVVAQTFTDFEWIVIDGGSTDGSCDLIEKYSDRFSFWVCQPDSGIYNAINKGIVHANGEYIQILNSGDTLFEDTTLERLFQYNLDADINYGDAFLHYPDGTTINKQYPDTVTLHYFIHNVINHQATFFKRQVFDGHLYNEKYLIAGDWAYCMEAVCRGLRFQHIHQTIVNYDNNGISAQWSERQIKEREEILDTYIPPQLKPDMDILNELHLLHKRRSTAFFYDRCLRFCKWWDKTMKTIEKWRQ